MSRWNTRGLRGSTLEEMVNITNDMYRNHKLALVQKIPTPINPLRLDGAERTISLAYFEKKSTVDYIGAVQGVPVCFDVKETGRKSLPLQNIHEHQIKFMDDFINQRGLAFLIVCFRLYNEYFYMPFDVLKHYWDGSRSGRRKSVPYEAFDKTLAIVSRHGYPLHYLEALDIYLKYNVKNDNA